MAPLRQIRHADKPSSTASDAIVASALARGIPVISGRQMLKWLDGRNASNFSGITWNGTTLSFTTSVGQGTNGIMAMVPIPSGRTVSSITRNGTPVSPLPSIQTIKGIQYAIFYGDTGSYQVTF